MGKIKVVHDTVGGTLTIWLDDLTTEHVCEETTEEVIVMKDKTGRVIGFELLHYHAAPSEPAVAVEAVVRRAGRPSCPGRRLPPRGEAPDP